MGRNSGKIFSGIKLGNVVKKNPITFTVTAKDQGIPQLTGQATVEVYIDRNKVSGRPQIIKPYPGQNITIPEVCISLYIFFFYTSPYSLGYSCRDKKNFCKCNC